jgi:hypothetical protein
MSDHSPKSFEQLVSEAPAAGGAGTVSLVGALTRAAEDGKFVLTTSDGRALTIETAAVKDHAVLGASVGQTIVRVDVDSAKLPADVAAAPAAAATPIKPLTDTVAYLDQTTMAYFDHPGTPFYFDHTIAYLDFHKPPIVDSPVTYAGADVPGSIVEGGGLPGEGGDPALAAAAVTPFALATPHQAASAYALGAGYAPGLKYAWQDGAPKPPLRDKHPGQEKALRDSGASNLGGWPD